MKVNVTYVAPTKTQSGADLTNITKVEIFNWMYPDDKFVKENPAPGEEITAQLSLMQGYNNRIRAIAYTGDAAGDMAETANFYAGLDVPKAPTNVKAVLSDDYKTVTLSWDPVSTEGENGGYVDPAAVTYYIFDAFGSYIDPPLVEGAVSPVTFDFSDKLEQDFAAFQVTAGNSVDYSLAGVSNVVVTGTAATAPWHESFSDCYYSAAWAHDLQSHGEVSASLWYDDDLQINVDAPEGTEPEYMHPHDLDNGFMLMLPYDKDDCFGINSVKIDISAASHPVFEFFYQGQGSKLEALVARNEGDFEAAQTIDLQQTPTDGWTRCRVDLTPYKDARYIRVGIRMTAIHNDDAHTWSVPLDNIRVIDLCDVDFRIAYAALDLPEAGKENTVHFTIENMGTADGGDAVASINDGDRTLADVSFTAVKAGEVRAASTVFTPTVLDTEPYELYFRIAADADAQTANNAVGPIKVEVAQSILPTVTDLAADKPGDNQIALSWNEPDFSALTVSETVEEGFEDPEKADFSATTWGDWRFDDLDGLIPYVIFHDYDNPFRGVRIGFQVFNYKKAGLPESEYVDVMPHSGDRMLIAASGQGLNSNWVISPRLNGEAQTIRFWAKSFTIVYPESLKVYYSTTDNKTASFTNAVPVGNYPESGALPEVWTEYTAELPAGALYFAIEHDAYDSGYLFVDDFTFQEASAYPADLALTGYNIWRDNEPLQNSTATSHTDLPTTDSRYSYRVSAVYNYGESPACDPVAVDFSYDSITDVNADGVTVAADADGITVKGAAGHTIVVVAADGRILYSGKADADLHVSAATGIYMVSVDGRATKAAVR